MDKKQLLYTDNHEWIEPQGDVRTVGITDHAQSSMGDIVFAELPSVGDEFPQGEPMLSIESPKAAAEVYAPLGGEVVEVNSALESQPELINKEPYEGGWIVKIRPTDPEGQSDKLMDHDAYLKLIGE